jgi:hemoglobin
MIFRRFDSMKGKSDIRGIEDIRVLVDEFYQKVREDELLAPIFNFRLSTHWEPHLEKMYSFWNAALFGVKGYNGSPFMKHATMQLTEEHFNRWLQMFDETLDTLFAGPVADDAKKRALIMADMFRSKSGQANTGNSKPIF